MLTTKKLETIVKGFANHRRIQILSLLDRKPNLSVNEISNSLKINLKTISEHTRRLAQAGLILKRYEGATVRHKVSPLGKKTLKFLRALSSLP